MGTAVMTRKTEDKLTNKKLADFLNARGVGALYANELLTVPLGWNVGRLPPTLTSLSVGSQPSKPI
jgi:hypothetical protein